MKFYFIYIKYKHNNDRVLKAKFIDFNLHMIALFLYRLYRTLLCQMESRGGHVRIPFFFTLKIVYIKNK